MFLIAEEESPQGCRSGASMTCWFRGASTPQTDEKRTRRVLQEEVGGGESQRSGPVDSAVGETRRKRRPESKL